MKADHVGPPDQKLPVMKMMFPTQTHDLSYFPMTKPGD